MLQHGKSVKRTSSSARSVAVEVLVLFLKIMLKSVIIRNSFSSVVGVSRGKRGRGFRAGGLEHISWIIIIVFAVIVVIIQPAR